MNHEQLPHDYRSSMQRAALAYLERHKAEHLVDLDRLFDNCVYHLTRALEVPVFIAQQLAHSAWSEMQSAHQPTWLGIDWGRHPDCSVVHLVDTRADLRYPVPARFLPQKLLDLRDTAHKQRPQ